MKNQRQVNKDYSELTMEKRKPARSLKSTRAGAYPEKVQEKEKKIIEILEQAKSTNDFFKFDKCLKQLHRLRHNTKAT